MMTSDWWLMMIDEVNEISDFGIYYEGDDKCYWLGLFTIS